MGSRWGDGLGGSVGLHGLFLIQALSFFFGFGNVRLRRLLPVALVLSRVRDHVLFGSGGIGHGGLG